MAIDTLGATLRSIKRMFTQEVVADLSNAQLLEQFLIQKDARAFEALVGRHGPMVLSVCRGMLHDAEAAFLILVRKRRTIRGRDSLEGWLCQVAHRVAIQANAATARRRTYEWQAGQVAVATSIEGPAAADDILPMRHEEITRLPEKYRLAVVHCDLKGMTQAQAAVPVVWCESTVRAALAVVNHAAAGAFRGAEERADGSGATSGTSRRLDQSGDAGERWD